ncbi:CRTAC1 family protein, partial [Acidobacteria bacterium AH-259-G07]|nr:CRTAC1 family protein [Acidobacteria bacterium AH-259-G07]
KEVTQQAGIKPNRLYGQGVAVGDYNSDGNDDLFITNFNGQNILYNNKGDGTFIDVTEQAGVAGDGRWSASAAFLDFNNDGYLDLYVTRYVDHSFDNNQVCGPWLESGIRTYCSPKVYDGLSDILYQNNGDGTFSDVSQKAGIAPYKGKGLGVVAGDFDLDGWMDIHVANDSQGNFLFRNLGDGTFEEVGLAQGVAFDENGNPQAGMGTDIGDFDGDGLPDLVVTNLDLEYLALYQNTGGFFEDVSSLFEVKLASRPFVGFGVGFVDFDNDADLDILVVNGHIIDNIALIREGYAYLQPKLLFENRRDHFIEAANQYGDALIKRQVSRGLAFGDYDNDGDVDALVSNCGQAPMLLRNQGGNRNNWLDLRLRGVKSNANGIGTKLDLKVGRSRLRIQVVGGGSYLSASTYRVHFGLGGAERVDQLRISWLAGTVDIIEGIAANQSLIVVEGKGICNLP